MVATDQAKDPQFSLCLLSGINGLHLGWIKMPIWSNPHPDCTGYIRHCLSFHDSKTYPMLLAVSCCDRRCVTDIVGRGVAAARLFCLDSLFTTTATLMPFDRSTQFNELWSQWLCFSGLLIESCTKPYHFLLEPGLICWHWWCHCRCGSWWLSCWNQLAIRIDTVVDRHRWLSASCRAAAAICSRCDRTIGQQLVDHHAGTTSTGIWAITGSADSRLMPWEAVSWRLWWTSWWSRCNCSLVSVQNISRCVLRKFHAGCCTVLATKWLSKQ